MLSRRVIVGDERQEDFDRLAAGWRAEYEPEGQAGESLLERVILNDWLLRRAEGQYLDAESVLAEVDPLERTDEQQHKTQLYLRYRTTAERSFYRAFYALRGLRKDKVKEELDVEKFRDEMKRALQQEAAIVMAERELKNAERKALAAQKAEELAAAQREQAIKSKRAQRPPNGRCAGRKRKKNGGAPVVIEQWIEVEVEGERAVTKLYPPNEELKKKAEAMEDEPELVYRRIHFPQGVPPEYAWVAAPADTERRERGGMGVQRMTMETWLKVIAREAASGTGHVGPTGVGNLPRPMERGGCECDVCTRNRELLEGKAA
jgi:hypothetical protein